MSLTDFGYESNRHSSVIFSSEAQINLVVGLVSALVDGASSVEVKIDAEKKYNAEIAARLESTVWNGGCNSWYKVGNKLVSTVSCASLPLDLSNLQETRIVDSLRLTFVLTSVAWNAHRVLLPNSQAPVGGVSTARNLAIVSRRSSTSQIRPNVLPRRYHRRPASLRVENSSNSRSRFHSREFAKIPLFSLFRLRSADRLIRLQAQYQNVLALAKQIRA